MHADHNDPENQSFNDSQGIEADHETPADEVIEALIAQLLAMITRCPATLPLISRMLDHIEETYAEEEAVAMVLEFSSFCRKRPELALLLTALSYADQLDSGETRST